MREIKTHHVDRDDNLLTIRVTDDVGPGGANHEYTIGDFRVGGSGMLSHLDFQYGPINGNPNGITNESLISVIMDRLHGFQTGPFACKENAEAMFYLGKALELLKFRTRDRIARGVEGKNLK